MRLLLLLLLLVVPVLVVVVAITMAVQAGRAAPTEYLTARELDVRRRWFRGVGTLLGLLGGVAVAATDSLGRGLLLAAPVVALGLLLGVLAAEAGGPTPELRGRRPVRSWSVRTTCSGRRPPGSVVAAVGVLLSLPLSGVAFVAGQVLVHTGCGSPWWPVGAVLALLLAVLGAVVLTWSVSVSVVGSTAAAPPSRA